MSNSEYVKQEPNDFKKRNCSKDSRNPEINQLCTERAFRLILARQTTVTANATFNPQQADNECESIRFYETPALDESPYVHQADHQAIPHYDVAIVLI